MAVAPLPPNGVRIVGERRVHFRDSYHRFLLMSLPAAIGVIVLAMLALNAVFALLYMELGGVANVAPGSFLDAFTFSMQTLATIGYGYMYPASTAAKILSDVEALTGVVLTALATGLLFTRFSRPRATLRFTSHAVISPMDGIPTFSFRVGNDRGNLIVEAQARLVMARTETTLEGRPFYRLLDLTLVRDRSIHFTRSWTIMHRITPDSPLYGMDAERMAKEEVEITCSVVGIDDTSLLQTHAQKRWEDKDILFGYRLADLLRVLPDGTLEADARMFDEVVQVEA